MKCPKATLKKKQQRSLKDNATLGLYKNKEYIKQLKKTAEEMGLDSRAFENVYKINDKMGEGSERA